MTIKPQNRIKEITMLRNPGARSFVFVILALYCAAGYAQGKGEETYKAHCQSCHGSSGMADTGPGRVTKTLPVTAPELKSRTLAEMINYTRDGKDRMRGFEGKLTDEEIKASVMYFRSLIR
jgi:mono/diheme cytochrome c family protein